MKKAKIMWVITISLFILLQVYNLFNRNYFDLIMSLLIIAIGLLLVKFFAKRQG